MKLNIWAGIRKILLKYFRGEKWQIWGPWNYLPTPLYFGVEDANKSFIWEMSAGAMALVEPIINRGLLFISSVIFWRWRWQQKLYQPGLNDCSWAEKSPISGVAQAPVSGVLSFSAFTLRAWPFTSMITKQMMTDNNFTSSFQLFQDQNILNSYKFRTIKSWG